MLFNKYGESMLALSSLIKLIFIKANLEIPKVDLMIDKNTMSCFLLTGTTIGTSNPDNKNYTIRIHNSGMSYREDINTLDNCRISDYINYRVHKEIPWLDFRELGKSKAFINLLFIVMHETMHIVDFMEAIDKQKYIKRQLINEMRVGNILSEIDDMNYPYMSCVIYRQAFPEREVNERVIKFIIDNVNEVLVTLNKIS